MENNNLHDYQKNSEFAVQQASKRSNAMKEIALKIVQDLHEFGNNKRVVINRQCNAVEEQISDLKKRYNQQEDASAELTRKSEQLNNRLDTLKVIAKDETNQDDEIIISPIFLEEDQKSADFTKTQVKLLAKHVDGGKKPKKGGEQDQDFIAFVIDIMVSVFESTCEYPKGKAMEIFASQENLNYECKNVDLSLCEPRFYDQILMKIDKARDFYATADIKDKDINTINKCVMFLKSIQDRISQYKKRDDDIKIKLEKLKRGSNKGSAQETEKINHSLELIFRQKNMYNQLDYQNELNSSIAFFQNLSAKRKDLFMISKEVDDVLFTSLGELPASPLIS